MVLQANSKRRVEWMRTVDARLVVYLVGSVPQPVIRISNPSTSNTKGQKHMTREQEKQRTQDRRQERQFVGRVSDYAYMQEQERERAENTRRALISWRKGGR